SHLAIISRFSVIREVGRQNRVHSVPDDQRKVRNFCVVNARQRLPSKTDLLTLQATKGRVMHANSDSGRVKWPCEIYFPCPSRSEPRLGFSPRWRNRSRRSSRETLRAHHSRCDVARDRWL